MTKLGLSVSAILLTVAMLAVPQLFSQEKAAKTEPAKGEAKKEAKGRLPNYYGKLDLSDDQMNSIYGIQAKYREQIDELEKQLADLKAKLATEVEEVLTEDQKTKLADLIAQKAKLDAEKTAEAQKASGTVPKPDPKALAKPDPKDIPKPVQPKK